MGTLRGGGERGIKDKEGVDGRRGEEENEEGSGCRDGTGGKEGEELGKVRGEWREKGRRERGGKERGGGEGKGDMGKGRRGRTRTRKLYLTRIVV